MRFGLVANLYNATMSASVVATNNTQYANFIAPNAAAIAAAAKACKSSPTLYWSISTDDNYADTFAAIWSALSNGSVPHLTQ